MLQNCETLRLVQVGPDPGDRATDDHLLEGDLGDGGRRRQVQGRRPAATVPVDGDSPGVAAKRPNFAAHPVQGENEV